MYTLGIDIGSTTSKCVVLRDGADIAASSIVIAGTGTNGPARALEQALGGAGITMGDIAYTVATGYGRMKYENADEQLSELSCHAIGVHHMFPSVRTVIDIGGQDAKALKVNDRGRMTSFVMNDKCAAGTGRFLDVMAQVLQMDISDLEVQAARAKKINAISNTCTVFAESEVISQLSNGEAISDIVAGICDSVAKRTAALAERVGVEEDVCMSGGVARNGGVRKAMERALGVPVLFSPLSQLMGALGASIAAAEKYRDKTGGL
ncbi:MAG: acyl-CoA dehydratase activase [Spirochaetaceae bacterium]|jgi:predicted CoA-substrate-specific enzyme activase|nr:acyl-CoA dehydratase activase [Spirochaetaceae bacterium]